MRRKNRNRNVDTSIDITPMIDIVFIMLIFFIVTATFIKESGLDLQKPDKIEQPQEQKVKSILVLIDENNQVWVDLRPIDIRAVRANIERLRAENSEGGVVIQADDEASNGILAQVWDAALQAGAPSVSLAP
ncbi:MAG: biopolymer transporter ExbD [Myxococcota bacterium]